MGFRKRRLLFAGGGAGKRRSLRGGHVAEDGGEEDSHVHLL